MGLEVVDEGTALGMVKMVKRGLRRLKLSEGGVLVVRVPLLVNVCGRLSNDGLIEFATRWRMQVLSAYRGSFSMNTR